jgi:hypothetical protein
MKTWGSFRQRLLVAMGLLSAGPACGTANPVPTPVAGGDATGSETGLGDVTSDGQASDVATADGTAEVHADAAPADTTVADAVDVAPVDATEVATADVAKVDSTSPDTSVPDTSVPDTTTVDAAPVEVSGDGVAKELPPAPDVDPTECKWGKPQEVCMTAEQLKQAIENPFQGGDGTGKKYDGPLPPIGCPEHTLVNDSCCNPAQGPGVLNGDKCCYVFCTGACCGRPFVVGGTARVADLVAAPEWCDEAQAAAGVEPVHAQALAEAWRQDGLDEHASVASFHRFGMELLAFGAPPELVADAAAAAGDEVRHARHCFTTAARLDGQRLGAGVLNCNGVELRMDLASAAAAAVVEGCIGETLSATQAHAVARGVQDRELRSLLLDIAADEERHAALAWRFVAWAWRTGDEGVRRAIRQAFTEALAAGPAPDRREAVLAGVPDSLRRAWGRLARGQALRIANEVLAQVVRPCAEALMAAQGSAHHGRANSTVMLSSVSTGSFGVR